MPNCIDYITETELSYFPQGALAYISIYTGLDDWMINVNICRGVFNQKGSKIEPYYMYVFIQMARNKQSHY